MDPGRLDEADDEPTGSSAAMPSMSAPSMKEKEERFVSHFPCRAWCEHCVRGKAKAMKHVRVDHSEEQVPVISVDYCFMNSKDDTVITEDTQSKHSPVLVVRDRWTRMVFSHVLPYKGVQKGPVGSKCLLNDLRKLGYSKMIVRYDPEPALQAVVEAAKNGFQGQLILEKIPVGVSESKGEIERAVQTIEGQSRTLRSALETSYGSKIGDDSVILTWLVEHAGTLHNLFHRSGEMKDGKTPYSRHRGREWRVSIPPFGETVEFLKRGHKFESRWQQGVFLGVKDNTTEKIVGNGSGVFTVQSIRRKSGDDKYNLEILQSVTGVPWDPQATRDDVPEGPRPAIVAGGPAEPLAQPVVVQAPKPKTSRRLYITKRDLEKYGYTAGCPACDGVQIGNRSTGVHHNDICRERIEECLRQEENNPRVVRFEARQEEEATGLPQTVGVSAPKILYGYHGERPYGLPDTCRVWAREDEDAINFKTTLAEGPEWKDVIWRVTRKKSNDQIISSRPIKEERSSEWDMPLPEKQTIIIELWYIPRKLNESPSSTRTKRSPEISEQEPQAKRSESEPSQGQKRPIPPGGESQSSKESRAGSAQASQGVKRRAEDEGDEERVRDIPDVEGDLSALILDHREMFLASIEGQDEPVCEEKIALPPELQDEAATWWYYDDISGKVLDSQGVQQARRDEIKIIETMKVWEKIPRSQIPAGMKTIGTRWVDVNKQDEENPLYRSRLVGQEIKRGSGVDEFFAAMPSLSTLKKLLAIAVTSKLSDSTGQVPKTGTRKLLGFLDVKRAHFYSEATREIYVELPSEGKTESDGDVVGRLKRSLYGTRDAPLNWELTIRKIMMKLGFTQGKSNPCIYYHKKRDLRTVVHGDDFTTAGSYENIKWLHESLGKEWMVVERGILGPPGTPNTIQDIRVLNRIISWKDEGIWWEPDSRHADLVVEILESKIGSEGRQGSKVKTPIAKPTADDMEKDKEFLSPEEASVYRSVAMRAAYLAQDRPDLQVATRSLAQGLQQPTVRHRLMLKRLARYLRYRPRMAQFFPHQTYINPFVMWTDSDHAGCIKTRKSVSGGVLMAGGCCIKTYSKGQGVVSLSTGEAEYYSLVSGASNLLGEVSTALDWGIKTINEVNMDASAGISMGSRRGLGKAKHVDTQFHWVQERVAQKNFKIKKVGTNDMLADVLTKPVPEATMNKALLGMNFHFLEGQHQLSLKK